MKGGKYASVHELHYELLDPVQAKKVASIAEKATESK